jgi:hypothetical protein
LKDEHRFPPWSRCKAKYIAGLEPLVLMHDRSLHGYRSLVTHHQP